MKKTLIPLAAVATASAGLAAWATEPCGDFGECKALIEINASDGDIGFHFLMDADDLSQARIRDPAGTKVFQERAKGPLAEQKLTETFVESSEPLCWFDPEADEDEEVVTLEEFLERWLPGTYTFKGQSDEGETLSGATELSFALPAAPEILGFDGSMISWMPGEDLGECATSAQLEQLVDDGVLPLHPESVAVAAWEIVLVPDVEDGDPLGGLQFSIRVPGSIAPMAVTVPADYLASLPDDTPAKMEIGAIGVDDNATFSEEGGLCLNEVEGCEEED